MAHIAGCGFYQMGQYESFHKRESWVEFYNLQDVGMWEQYITSIYFTFVSMMTIGYGDIGPISTNEKIYVIVMTIISGGIFGYCVNKISQIFTEMQMQKKKLQHQQEIILMYCKKRQINQNLQTQILKNLEYVYESQNSQDLEGQHLMNNIQDEQVFKQFKQNYFGQFFKESTFFNNNFSKDCIEDLANKMQEVQIKKGQFIFEEGESPNKLYYFIEGRIEYCRKNKYNNDHDFKLLKLGVVQKKMFLGLNDFIGSQNYQESIISGSECRLAYIDKQQFLKIIHQYKQDEERLYQFQEEIKIERKKYTEEDACKICKIQAHNKKDCPQLHLSLKKNISIHKYLHSKPQENRLKYCRYQKQLFQTKNENDVIRYQLKDLRIDILYIYYDYTLNNEDEEHIFDEQVVFKPENDKEFFRLIPSIMNNQVSQKRIDKQDCNHIYKNPFDLDDDMDVKDSLIFDSNLTISQQASQQLQSQYLPDNQSVSQMIQQSHLSKHMNNNKSSMHNQYNLSVQADSISKNTLQYNNPTILLTPQISSAQHQKKNVKDSFHLENSQKSDFLHLNNVNQGHEVRKQSKTLQFQNIIHHKNQKSNSNLSNSQQASSLRQTKISNASIQRYKASSFSSKYQQKLSMSRYSQNPGPDQNSSKTNKNSTSMKNINSSNNLKQSQPQNINIAFKNLNVNQNTVNSLSHITEYVNSNPNNLNSNDSDNNNNNTNNKNSKNNEKLKNNNQNQQQVQQNNQNSQSFNPNIKRVQVARRQSLFHQFNNLGTIKDLSVYDQSIKNIPRNSFKSQYNQYQDDLWLGRSIYQFDKQQTYEFFKIKNNFMNVLANYEKYQMKNSENYKEIHKNKALFINKIQQKQNNNTRKSVKPSNYQNLYLKK